MVFVKLTIYDPGMTKTTTATTGFPPFAVTVDLVVLTVRQDALHVLLVTRGEGPFIGELALPGGSGHLEQLASYGSPDRDPRMRVISVAFLALAPNLPDPVAGSDAAAAHWLPIGEVFSEPARLAFDHNQILSDGVERAKAKLEYTPLATAFCPPEFTVAQLRHVYQAVWQEELDPRNFHRKVTRTAGFLVDTGRSVSEGPGRPAALFRRGRLETLTPPLLREHHRATL
jgi:8-oxo-dGTP diphosphatase